MAYLKITDLEAATSVNGSDVLLLNQSNTTKKVTVDNLLSTSERAENISYTPGISGLVSTNVQNAITELKTGVDTKVETSELAADYYTKSAVDTLVATIPTFNIKVVSSLPTENISDTTIYLLTKSSSGGVVTYEMWIHSEGEWKSLGTQSIDLSTYAKIEYVDTSITNAKPASQHSYINTDSHLTATTVQAAITELKAIADTKAASADVYTKTTSDDNLNAKVADINQTITNDVTTLNQSINANKTKYFITSIPVANVTANTETATKAEYPYSCDIAITNMTADYYGDILAATDSDIAVFRMSTDGSCQTLAGSIRVYFFAMPTATFNVQIVYSKGANS